MEPTAENMEDIWRDTRELIFRLGNGSLASFIALASACSSNSTSMLWDGVNDLELTKEGHRIIWCANPKLVHRYSKILETIIDAQKGEYLGCAALFARSSPLPLASAWSEPRDALKEQNIFSELLRWITAVARKQYFSCFP